MRPIDADSLQAQIDEILCDEEAYGYIDEFEISKLIKDAPTVDAVPVVRCKDCKYRGTDDCPMHFRGVAPNEDFLVRVDNDFCSYGERREEK